MLGLKKKRGLSAYRNMGLPKRGIRLTSKGKSLKPRVRGGKKPPSLTKLMKRADRLFSAKVRQLNFPVSTLPCFTCGNVFNKKNLQCGHFLSRFYKSARWHEDNARPQCMMCNMWKRGDPIRFRQNLIKEIGIERVEAVEAMRDQPTKLTREFLENLIKELSV